MYGHADASTVSLWSLSWSQLICLLFLRLPRIVPRVLLKYTTSTEAPFPEVIRLPSREPGRTIYCWIFVPPESSIASSRDVPIHVDFHGGGFISGQLAEQAPFCSLISRSLGSVVLTVDYRMGPLQKHPAAIHDAEDVVRACMDERSAGYAVLREHVAGYARHRDTFPIRIDATRLSLSGFSSGGNVALNLLLSLPEWPSPLNEAQHPYEVPALLFYPSLDSRQLPHQRPLPAGMRHSGGILRWLSDVMAHAYLQPRQRAEVRASPGLARVGKSTSNGSEDVLIKVGQSEAVLAEGDVGHDDPGTTTPRATVSEPRSLHPRAHALIILPSQDSLAHQSNVWLHTVEEAGLLVSTEARTSASESESTRGVTPLRVPGASHGWTQFPDVSLNERQRQQKYDVFGESIAFVQDIWS
ncbi:unnamed protein product [Parajaminaea phylloscopi]